MIKLYNQKEQKWYDVPSNEASQRLGEGWVGEAGVDYPVVNPDGKTTLVPAEDLNNAVQQGYRFTTQADIDRNVEAETRRINEQNFGDPLQAGVTEFASQGLLGIPDALARTGEELGVDALQGFTEARKAQRELSPNATLAGGVASLLIPGGGLVGAAAKGAKELNAVKNLGTLGQLATEGAVMGLGPGITEAALGRPEDIAETIMISGLLGGALNVATPFAVNGLKKIGQEGVSATKQLVDLATKKSMGLAVPVNQALGRSEDAALIREVLDLTPEARRAIANNPEYVTKIADEVKASQKAIKQETAKLTSDLQSAIKNMPKDLQESFQQTLKENANNLTAALDDTYSRYREIDNGFNELIGGLNGPPKTLGSLYGKSAEAIERLQTSANPRVKQAAEQIAEQLDSYGLRNWDMILKSDGERAFEATAVMNNPALTEGVEVNLARTLKRDLNRSASKLMSSDTANAKLLQKFADEIDQIAFKGHPNPFVAETATEMDRLYRPLAELRKQFLGKSGTYNAKSATGKQVDRLFIDPEFRLKFETHLPQLLDQFPQLTKIATEIEGSAAQKAVINDLQASIKSKVNDPNNLSGKLDSDDIVELARTMTGIEPRYGKVKVIKDAGTRLESLKAQQDVINAAPNAFDKLLLIKKAQGLPVADDLKEMGKYYQIMDKLSQFSKGGEAKTLFDRAVGSIPVVGPLLTAASNTNPAVILKRLAALEKATQSFEKAASKAVEGAAQSFVTGAKGVAIRTLPYQNPRQEYKTKTKFLTDMSTPEAMTQQIENLTGNSFSDSAPGIQTAVGTQYAKTVSYLQSKMPQDPLAGKSLFYDKTGYQPADSQVSSFLRHVKAAEDPMSVLKSIQTGDVTKEEVDTLKAIYPQMYQRLQESITNAIIDHGEQIPYKRRLILGTMFNVPTDPTLDPAFINKMQASSVPGAQPGRPDGAQDGQPRGSRLQLSDDSLGMSDTQRVTYK